MIEIIFISTYLILLIVILNIKYGPVMICIAIAGWGTYNPKHKVQTKKTIYIRSNIILGNSIIFQLKMQR